MSFFDRKLGTVLHKEMRGIRENIVFLPLSFADYFDLQSEEGHSGYVAFRNMRGE
jgi:hypothetical protein